MFTQDSHQLTYTYDHETLIITPWGPNALRIRATKNASMPSQDWALDTAPPATPAPTITITHDHHSTHDSHETPRPAATLVNGTIRASLTHRGKLSIHNIHTNTLLLEEYSRTRLDVRDPKASALGVAAREFTPRHPGSTDYTLTYRLESLRLPRGEKEKLYGMGQYQQPNLDLKGCDLELAQRNSQASVPFLLSSVGYGLLWNNPSVGRAVLGANIMSFEARSTDKLDFWIVTNGVEDLDDNGGPDHDDDDDDAGGDQETPPSTPSTAAAATTTTTTTTTTKQTNPKALVQAYTAITGLPPPMPSYALGFWQSKLRYQTQSELLAIAREHVTKRRLPLSVLVIDFFHWRAQGDWSFDPTYWPDPQAMVDELRSLGVEPMVSIWPTVQQDSENWDEMLEKGLLIRNERGFRAVMDFQGNTVHFDATNAKARKYVWGKAVEGYGKFGIRLFWLDEAEPEYGTYDFDNWRYHAGTQLAVGNVYPRMYSQGFYEGALEEADKKESKNATDNTSGGRPIHDLEPNTVNLVRCAWAGSQKYGALVWSGDIASSWASLRSQVVAGLNMGIAGIAYWTTDIGGFHGGDPTDPAFRELLVRWFQWGTFLPVMRLHGDRYPQREPLGNEGGGKCPSGADNEVWSYGEEVGGILERYLWVREGLREYLQNVMKEASEEGTPVIRALFLEFPSDAQAWEIEDEYLLGARYLVAPVLYPGMTKRTVYFPRGAQWKQVDGDKTFRGGSTEEVDAPLERMPVFERV
ncbi:glycoside hydrolase family 31 protein [Coniella lustricola]|uniref:Glycoside hydrolase family 31 protein n=1 Tax=Coniella lustricola TaxID=2025994 RepID=A0A2T2ZTG6_9PEZI|nr:glycoside hydrolase family 31 protein [Coniella lustricola]